jgi:hypothetical protein
VPRVCVLLGECVNCLDTDLFCQEQCSGGSWQKFCTHWVRLSSEGRAKVGEDQSVTVDLAAAGTAERRKPRNLKEVYLDYLRRRKGKSK